jgi:hypothetical protein
MSIQVPYSLSWIETLTNMAYMGIILILFAFSWNFEAYQQKLKLGLVWHRSRLEDLEKC